MRLCRYDDDGRSQIGFYDESQVISLVGAAVASGITLDVAKSDELLDYLPHGKNHPMATELAAWLAGNPALPEGAAKPTSKVELLVPIPRPNKLLLLAGNYAAHIEEGGGIAAEREETFPYVFMKPPTTTLTNPGAAITLPAISPATIDWELELGVVIGREAKGVKESEALDYVAGYTVINDISNRRFRPNPNRKTRDKDSFFDWLHGKWFDSFCPCGPCVTAADALADPQDLALELKVGEDVKQSFSTAAMVFPVAAVIEFISSFVTLEPGDIISTGTGPGVGASSETFLKPGDVMRASISSIGVLESSVIAES